jgi:hypothetical protein
MSTGTAYTIQDEVIGPLTCRKCTVLNGNFVFNLPDVLLYSKAPILCSRI